ncbi:unnamed protein product [Urochloa decumbens]|uniref:Uncharacterized protein n=1 Tax=Urochloa decumbens TaxID=240449 RepID=A0ABC9DCU2_9POAL
MATRAIAAVAGRRSGLAAVLSSFRRGGARGMSHSSAQRRQEDHQGAAGGEDAAAQVEASQNRKNVEVVQGEDQSATLLADEAADDAWVPDQETGVFVPAEEATAARQAAAGAPPSVLDQTVFVREEMEDVERPAVDMDAHGGGAK